MDDNDTSTASSAGEHTIPKQRLNEEIAKVNELRAQLQMANAQVQLAMNQARPQQPVRLDPELERLKEENPVVYKRLMKSEMDNRRTSAGLWNINQELDKHRFETKYGKLPKRHLEKVEEEVAKAHASGNTTVGREAILAWVLGSERANEALSGTANTIIQEAPQSHTQTSDAPPSNPKFAGSTPTGTASRDFTKLSVEDRAKALEDVEF